VPNVLLYLILTLFSIMTRCGALRRIALDMYTPIVLRRLNRKLNPSYRYFAMVYVI